LLSITQRRFKHLFGGSRRWRRRARALDDEIAAVRWEAE
jgi:hypothetical protein